MRPLYFAAALAFLSACSPKSGTVYTVDELTSDDALLMKILGECRNNPGELHNTPNCQNAEAADVKLRFERMRQSLGG